MATTKPEKEEPPVKHDVVDLFGEELLKKEVDQLLTVKTAEHLKGKYVGIYFSAQWCPPCKAFTPILRKFYLYMNAKGTPFEVVFVSADADERAFKSYYTGTMPWLAVPFSNEKLRKKLSTQFEVQGIPTLAILGPDGEVLNRNARASLIKDADGKNFPWKGEHGTTPKPNQALLLILFLVLLFIYYKLL